MRRCTKLAWQERLDMKTIGTIIHGALGDCYEQLCAIRNIRKSDKYNDTRWVGFFAAQERLNAMKHFDLEMLDEIHLASNISSIDIDIFYQFQIFDGELQRDIISKLPDHLKLKFDLTHNIKPWNVIKQHDYHKAPLELCLSAIGKEYLPINAHENLVDMDMFGKRVTIGYLWRYRSPGGAIKPYFQKSKNWIIHTKSELFKHLIKKHDAHIIICGMKKDKTHHALISKETLDKAGFVEGEYRAKCADYALDLPDNKCTYLKGLGFAAELEMISKCDIIFTMPSGFSEALWMKRPSSVLLIDPPPDYLIKIGYNRMPLFNNLIPSYMMFNNFTTHTVNNVMDFIAKKGLLA